MSILQGLAISEVNAVAPEEKARSEALRGGVEASSTAM